MFTILANQLPSFINLLPLSPTTKSNILSTTIIRDGLAHIPATHYNIFLLTYGEMTGY